MWWDTDSSVYEFSDIEPRVKYLHRVVFEEATAISRLALTKTGKERFDLLEEVIILPCLINVFLSLSFLAFVLTSSTIYSQFL